MNRLLTQQHGKAPTWEIIVNIACLIWNVFMCFEGLSYGDEGYIIYCLLFIAANIFGLWHASTYSKQYAAVYNDHIEGAGLSGGKLVSYNFPTGHYEAVANGKLLVIRGGGAEYGINTTKDRAKQVVEAVNYAMGCASGAPQGGFNNRQGGFSGQQGGFNNPQNGFNSQQGNFSAPQSGEQFANSNEKVIIPSPPPEKKTAPAPNVTKKAPAEDGVATAPKKRAPKPAADSETPAPKKRAPKPAADAPAGGSTAPKKKTAPKAAPETVADTTPASAPASATSAPAPAETAPAKVKYLCLNCGTVTEIPANLGKIVITCPSCKQQNEIST